MFPASFARFVVAVLLATTALVIAAPVEQTPLRIEVTGVKHDAGGVPVTMVLPEAWRRHRQLTLFRTDSGAAVPVKRSFSSSGETLSWILPAGPSRSFALHHDREHPVTAVFFEPLDHDNCFVLKAGDRPILQYRHAITESPAGLDPVYRRSGYIHPLFTPSGRAVTGDFPPDHAHQHGIFFPWVRTTFEGRKVDFWNQAGRTGDIRHMTIPDRQAGTVFAELTATLAHRDLTAPGGPKTVLEETWTVRTYDLSSHFLVDLESRQTCVASSPLKIHEYHYGGMAIRGSHEWYDAELEKRLNRALKDQTAPDALRKLAPPRDYLTSEGKTWVDGNATRARWVAMHGRVDGQPAWVAILGHPENFRAPQPVRLHPGKPYFCFAPMALGDFEIKPGETYVSRYRLVTSDGPVDAKRIERLWRDYAEPPGVVVRNTR